MFALTDRYGVRPWVIISVGAAALCALVGFIIWGVLQPNGGCATGQHQQLVTEMPMLVGKVVVMQPVYDCVPN